MMSNDGPVSRTIPHLRHLRWRQRSQAQPLLQRSKATATLPVLEMSWLVLKAKQRKFAINARVLANPSHDAARKQRH
jgi:hypothetical protein